MAEAGKRELPAAAESTVAADGGSAPPIKSQKIIALVGVNAGRVACVSVLQREGIKMPPVRQVIIGFVLLVAVIAVAKFLNSGASIYDLEQHIDDVMNGPALFISFTLILALYLLPVWVAYACNHRQFLKIAALNVLLGWTVLGWLGALLWACINGRRSDEINPGTSGAVTQH